MLLSVGLQKPGPKSKAKDHKECLKKRIVLWKNGEIDKLLNEGRIIQSRIGKGKKSEPLNRAKIFAKLVMEGQINSAMRFLNDDISGGVLPVTDDRRNAAIHAMRNIFDADDTDAILLIDLPMPSIP